MKVVIIGGVAAGASTAARLRRLDETAEIILMERGKTISYANCGLPYHLGGTIEDREDLIVMPSEKFKAWFNIDVRTEHEVLEICRDKKLLQIQTPQGRCTETYDKLVLATGASPMGEVFTNDNHPRLSHLWTLADMDRLLVKLGNAKRVIVVGAGFVGLEAAENLRERNLEVTLIQREDQILTTLDKEMTKPLLAEVQHQGIVVHLNTSVDYYTETSTTVTAHLITGETIEADMVVVATGVKPNSDLAQTCGLACNNRGYIIVNEQLQTSDPNIYAAGDVIEVYDPILKGRTTIPLAGPANKQGRIVANNLVGGQSVYRGSFGTSIIKIGSLTAASVGLTERRLVIAGLTYRKFFLHPASHATYYPGASRLSIKVLFADDGTLYGAQIVGKEGVDKRIDTLAQAMRTGLKITNLAELELAYAPPYGSAKDPVNFIGFIGENILSGLSDVVTPDAIPENAIILDTREAGEYAAGAIPGAINIPLTQLRLRLGELDKTQFYVVHCQVGLRGYLAERILKQHGFKCANLSGGWLTWQMFN